MDKILNDKWINITKTYIQDNIESKYITEETKNEMIKTYENIINDNIKDTYDAKHAYNIIKKYTTDDYKTYCKTKDENNVKNGYDNILCLASIASITLFVVVTLCSYNH